MDLTEALREIDWPDSFYDLYCDGQSELLLRGDGIALTPPSDDPDGIGGFDATIPKRQLEQQFQGRRYVPYNELDRIVAVDGNVLLCRSDRR